MLTSTRVVANPIYLILIPTQGCRAISKKDRRDCLYAISSNKQQQDLIDSAKKVSPFGLDTQPKKPAGLLPEETAPEKGMNRK